MTYPLWLPRGSVRAIITLSIGLTTLVLIFLNPTTIPVSLTNVFIVAVTFYYSTRSSVVCDDENNVKTESTETPPLYMPKSTVRISLAVIAGISLIIAYIGTQSIPQYIVTVLITIFGFVLGLIVKKVISQILHQKQGKSELWGHVQAAIILSVVIITCLIDILYFLPILTASDKIYEISNQALELAVGYYFGSRK